MTKHLVCLCASLFWASVAFADAMPSCPPGQKLVVNPTPPGAMHHGGGHCEKDPDYKPGNEPPKLSPEAETAAKNMAIAKETAEALKQKAALTRAQAEEARMKAQSAKGTPDEATLQKTADDLSKQADDLDKQALAADEAAKKAADEFKKLSSASPQNTTASTPENQSADKGDSAAKTNAEKKSGGCAVSPTGASSWWVLFLGLLLVWRAYQLRAKREA